MLSKLLLVASLVTLCLSQVIQDESWGYVDTRPDAHMFYWIYGKLDAKTRDQAPLVLWLQGGPGASSTGFGNFEEIGPLDDTLTPRNATWASVANLIFIDNPVGTGFSYVDKESAFAANEDQIAADLVAVMQAVVTKYPILQKSPFYIFSESYGGKMAASFAKALTIAITAKQITMNFKAVAMGDSWIDPMSFVKNWGPYLVSTSEMDRQDLPLLTKLVNQTQQQVNKGQWVQATNSWGNIENLIGGYTDNVDWYNILDRTGDEPSAVASKWDSLSSPFRRYMALTSSVNLDSFMNGPMRKKLGVIPNNVTWGGQSSDVFDHLAADFMQSVVPTVDWLLANNVRTIVYSGNLDLICCTPGTLDWMATLKWTGLPSWTSTRRVGWFSNGLEAGFRKTYQNLDMFFIFASGHMVPSDQPEAALDMLSLILGA